MLTVLQNLTVEVEQDGERRSVILEDDWTATDIRIGLSPIPSLLPRTDIIC